MKWMLRLLTIAAIVYLSVLVFVYVFQRNFIYFPLKQPVPKGFEQFYNVKSVEIDVDGIGAIKSVFHPPEPGEPFIMVFHGNGSEAYQLTAEIDSFHEWGAGFLMVEYPGYGLNPGKPSEGSILTTAEAHYEWAVSQGIDPESVVLYGHSLGAASAIHLASERQCGLLVVSAPFLSARAMGKRQMPFFPTGLLLKDQYRSDLKMPKVEAPLLVIHGRKDRVIPHAMGKALSELHSGKNTFVSVENANHNNLWRSEMPSKIKQAIFANIYDETR